MLIKKTITSVMICLLISHGIIQFTLFKIFQSKHKANNTEIINNGVAVNQQILFKFQLSNFNFSRTNIEWKDDDELMYEGEMYDLVKKEIMNDTVYLYCLHDESESELYSILQKFIGLIYDENSDNADELTSINIYLNQEYSVSYSTLNNCYPRFSYKYHANFLFSLIERENSVITPPPKV